MINVAGRASIGAELASITSVGMLTKLKAVGRNRQLFQGTGLITTTAPPARAGGRKRKDERVSNC